MSDEQYKVLRITRDDLLDWIDRPPSNADIELANYLVNALDNQRKYYEENQQLKEKVDYLKSKSENKDTWCQLIADIGYDYDGYRDAESLMSLIDELVKYSLYARDDYDYNTFQEEGNNE